MSQYNHVSHSGAFDPVYIPLWIHQRHSTSVDWLIGICIQKRVLCLAEGVKVGKILDHVTIDQLPSAARCVCGFWLAGIVVPRDSNCKILLHFWQKQLRATCTPSTSGVVVLAGGCRALARRPADGRTEKWVVQEPTATTVPDALTQLGARTNRALFKAPELQVGHCFTSASGSQSKELASSGELNPVL